MGRSEHAYNFAALESRYGQEMRTKNITDPQDKQNFL